MENRPEEIVLCFGRRVLNLTPHEVRIRPKGFSRELDIVLPSAGVARAVPGNMEFESFKFMVQAKKKCLKYDAVKVCRPPRYVNVEGIPPQIPEEDVPVDIIVSMVVAQAMQDLGITWNGAIFTPNTNPQEVVRDKEGRIEAVRSLVVWSNTPVER